MYKNIYIIPIGLGDMKLYSVFRMISYINTQFPFPFFYPPPSSVYQIYVCIHLLYM